MMLDGIAMLGAAFGFLLFIWASVLFGSRYFGSAPER
jgi:hypothetical protein